jgi:hypothetical protein
MSRATLPHQQQYISGTSATDGAQAFAGIVYGNVYYGNTVARERKDIGASLGSTVELILYVSSKHAVAGPA